MRRAEKEGRDILYEHEVYEILKGAGVKVPRYTFINKDQRPPAAKEIVLKVVSPYILHKTEAGGVKIVEKDNAQKAIRSMLGSIPRTYAAWIEKNRKKAPVVYQDLKGEALKKAIRKDIIGFLAVEKVDFEKQVGHELLIGLKWDDAFGHVLAYSVGGTRVHFYADELGKENCVSLTATKFADKKIMSDMVRRPFFSKILSGELRGESIVIDEKKMIDTLLAFKDIANTFSDLNSDYYIKEMEVNPFVASKGNLVAIDGNLRFARSDFRKVKKPLHKIKNLLDPETVGIVGVSAKNMTPATVIHRKLLDAGLKKENIMILHPRETKINGCRCFKDLDGLKKHLGKKRLDTFIVGAPAIAPPGANAGDIVKRIITDNIAESMTIISSGFGETSKGKQTSKEIKELLFDMRDKKNDTPLINGPNTIGVKYYNKSTVFTPWGKSSYNGIGKKNVSTVCQSGAFMVMSLSDFAYAVDPPVVVAVGNQIDVTVSEFLEFLMHDKNITVFGLYIEGLQPFDGLCLARTIRKARNAGNDVIIYKAGRTKDGSDATKSHTASTAGSYETFRAIMEEAGAYVASDIEEYHSILTIMSLLSDTVLNRRSGYPQLAGMSNAGFEKCALADATYDIDGTRLFEIATLSEKTKIKVENLFTDKGISDLIDTDKIFDMGPSANDEVFELTQRMLLEDINVDACVFANVPETPSVMTLSGFNDEDINSPDSIIQRMIKIRQIYKKPFVASLESGYKYQPAVDLLIQGGVPVFRHVDLATRYLGRYLRYRMR